MPMTAVSYLGTKMETRHKPNSYSVITNKRMQSACNTKHEELLNCF